MQYVLVRVNNFNKYMRLEVYMAVKMVVCLLACYPVWTSS